MKASPALNCSSGVMSLMCLAILHLMPKLSLAERRRVREAQERALTTLGDDELPGEAHVTLGLMGRAGLRATARQLLDTARI